MLALFFGSIHSAFSQSMRFLEGMSDLLKTNDKYYVVISVIVIIFIGFVFYLWKVDRKLSKIEKDIEQSNH